MTEIEYSKGMYQNAFPGYLENQSVTDAPYQIDWNKGLEKIVSDVRPEKDDGILGRLFSNKTKIVSGKRTVNTLNIKKV